MRPSKKPRSGQIGPDSSRGKFWNYCTQTAGAAKARAIKAGVPCTITAYDIDELLVNQDWRCAISNAPLAAPKSGGEYRRHPFGPSLDRVNPEFGYVRSNIRVVCNMVNTAINEWGLDNFIKLLDAVAPFRETLPYINWGLKPEERIRARSRRRS